MLKKIKRSIIIGCIILNVFLSFLTLFFDFNIFVEGGILIVKVVLYIIIILYIIKLTKYQEK